MLEVLTANQIVEVSRKWQQKLYSIEPKPFSYNPISYQDLFNEVRDITQIRRSVGLVPSDEDFLPYNLTTKEINFSLCFSPKRFLQHNEEVGISMWLPQSINPALLLREGYSIVKKYLDTFVVRHSVTFISPLTGKEEGMVKDPIYEILGFEYLNDCFENRILARALWGAHLLNDAPLQKSYLLPVSTA